MNKAAHSGKTGMQWYAEVPSNWREETIGLSHEAKGIYADLRAIYWLNDCELPGLKLLKRKIGMSPDSGDTVILSILSEYFPEGRNAFLDTAKEAANKISKVQSERASKRWNKDKDKEAEHKKSLKSFAGTRYNQPSEHEEF